MDQSVTGPVQLRIARPVRRLAEMVTMYQQGLDWEVLGRFENHDGFDGVMLGRRGDNVHLEFTFCRHHPVQPTPSAEDLLVFYVPQPDAWAHRCQCLLAAGLREVAPFNPYWGRNGRSFEDPDGYRLVIQRAPWAPGPTE